MRFEISEPLGSAVYCHCTRCQRRTGAAAGASAWLAPGSLTLTQGEDQLRAWAPGDGFEKVFCGDLRLGGDRAQPGDAARPRWCASA